MMRSILIILCILWYSCDTRIALAQSDQVLRAQESLEAIGFAPGPVDGLIGPRTREAIREFQRSRNLSMTGELDVQTQTALSASVNSTPHKLQAPGSDAISVPPVTVETLPAPSGSFAPSIARDDKTSQSVFGQETGQRERTAVARSMTVASAVADRNTEAEGFGTGIYWAVAGAGLAFLWWIVRRSRRAAPAAPDVSRLKGRAKDESLSGP